MPQTRRPHPSAHPHVARPGARASAAIAAGLVLGAALGACSPLSNLPVPDIGALPAASPMSTPGGAAPGASGPVTPSQSPAASSPAQEAVAVIDGFKAFAASPPSYRVAFRGVSRHTTDVLDVKGDIEVDGGDVALAAVFDFPGEGKARSEWRLVDGKDWLRIDRGRWRSLTSPKPGALFDPFMGVHDGSHIQYLGPVKGEPGRYQVQLTAVYLHPALIPAYNLTAEKITKTKLLLIVDGTGRPISGTWNMEGQGRVSGQLQAVAIDLDLVFSKFGADFAITKP
jgi:hypothetical protein